MAEATIDKPLAGISPIQADLGMILTRSARRWWDDVADREGSFAATRKLIAALWEFARDSTPERRRRRLNRLNLKLGVQRQLLDQRLTQVNVIVHDQ